jgi:hypothetical protein
MLESTERDVVVRILRNNIFTVANAGAVLLGAIGPDLAAQIPDALNPQLRTEAAVTFCERQPWRRQGDHPLIDLLNVVRALEPSIRVIIQRLRAVPLPPNPLQAEILDNGILFLGRDKLRTLLPGLWDPAGHCVLRINGETKTGKSYSFRFLQFLMLQNQPIIPVKMEKPGPTIGALEVAETLVMRMGCAPDNKPKLTNETALRAGQLLADWVLNLALRSEPSNWWFVLDNFDDEALPDDTKEFVRQMALQIANGRGRRTMRLILINYKAKLPREVNRLQAEELLPNDPQEWLRLVRTYYDRLAAPFSPERQRLAMKARDLAISELQDLPFEKFLEALSDAVEDDTYELTAK